METRIGIFYSSGPQSPHHTVSIANVSSNQSNQLNNPVNAAHLSEIKAKLQLAARQRPIQTPGTAESPKAPTMPGSGPGRLLNAYA